MHLLLRMAAAALSALTATAGFAATVQLPAVPLARVAGAEIRPGRLAGVLPDERTHTVLVVLGDLARTPAGAIVTGFAGIGLAPMADLHWRLVAPQAGTQVLTGLVVGPVSGFTPAPVAGSPVRVGQQGFGPASLPTPGAAMVTLVGASAGLPAQRPAPSASGPASPFPPAGGSATPPALATPASGGTPFAGPPVSGTLPSPVPLPASALMLTAALGLTAQLRRKRPL